MESRSMAGTEKKIPQGGNGSTAKGGKSKMGKNSAPSGLRFKRFFTQEGVHPFDTIKWTKRTSRIVTPEGKVVFEMKDVEVPDFWSQLATDILASKYIRKAGVPGTGHETGAKQVITRIARSIRLYGEKLGYFASAEDAKIFEEELTYLLVHQFVAFNSPVWFNCGLYTQYGIKGETTRNWYWNETTNEFVETVDAYSRPQLSACFIVSIGDDLMDIAEHVKREMKIFKFGSGAGTNFSNIRAEGEKLSSGGTSSGLMSFLHIYDRAAGAIKSGGTTRRAAKMVVLDADHPEIVQFIKWKESEEEKALALMKAGFSGGMDGEAYKTVSGQNSNNSVRVTDDFMKKVLEDGIWETRYRKGGGVAKTYRAREIFDLICKAAWRCADPGLQFHDTVNKWHTCKNTAPIRASNPCSEFMFLDDSACNLASLNLVKFLDDDNTFNVEKYKRAIDVTILAQEIIVDLASYPTKEICQNSHNYRPLGLGYANLGSLLMRLGIPYDSDGARSWCGALTSIMCGRAYYQSALFAQVKGPFEGFAKNREPMLKVIQMHRDACNNIAPGCPENLIAESKKVWDDALDAGKKYGFRNAQATVIAPTGTIGLLMDCDTTGIEPDFALVKFKNLAGGGYLKIVNSAVPSALKKLGYDDAQIKKISDHIIGHGTFDGAPHINTAKLLELGFSDEDIDKLESKLPSCLNLEHVFTVQNVPQNVLKQLGVDPNSPDAANVNILELLGFNRVQIEEASKFICGWQTIEEAPGLKPEHLPVFDCANRCGPYGKRAIHHLAHVRMLAAAQPFISGSISKTINMPNDATVDDIKEAYILAWKMGLKCIAIYRDGSKGVQALTTTVQDKAVATEGSIDRGTSQRVKLPQIRHGLTYELRIGGHKMYLRTGQYEDGRVGEIFVDMYKEGAEFRSLLNSFAIAVSLGLQHGVPLKEYVDAFTYSRFQPNGVVEGHPNVKFATSVIDLIFRILGIEYLNLVELGQVKTPSGGYAIEPKVIKPANLTKEKRNPNAPVLDQQLASINDDAPLCNVCGHLTLRQGANCYRCLNCANSLGCN